MAPGIVQLSIFGGNKKLAKYVKDGNLRRWCSFSYKRNEKEWILTNSLLFRWLTYVLVWEHLKTAGLFMNSSFQVVASLMSLWWIAWLACLQNVPALRMLRECSTRCHLELQSARLPWNWDMWNVSKSARHRNYFNKCNRRLCQCNCTWRGRMW
jgi:hypothetical protein